MKHKKFKMNAVITNFCLLTVFTSSIASAETVNIKKEIPNTQLMETVMRYKVNKPTSGKVITIMLTNNGKKSAEVVTITLTKSATQTYA